MALGPIFLTRAIEAAPLPSTPNVFSCYPHRQDWWNRYPALRTAYGRKHTLDEFEWMYQHDKRLYQDSVLKRLRQIEDSKTGPAVLAEMRAHSSYSACIFPWDFAPTSDGHRADDLGVMDPIQIPQTPRERRLGLKPPGTKYHDVRGWYYADLANPGSTDIFYTDYRVDEPGDEPGVLLHELVHAMRVSSGAFHKVNMRKGRGYPNSEEFYANTIEMIYRSEKGLRIYDYEFHPMTQASVLNNPQAHALLTELCHKQQSLAIALAQVNTAFNPIKAVADKLLTIDL